MDQLDVPVFCCFFTSGVSLHFFSCGPAARLLSLRLSRKACAKYFRPPLLPYVEPARQPLRVCTPKAARPVGLSLIYLRACLCPPHYDFLFLPRSCCLPCTVQSRRAMKLISYLYYITKILFCERNFRHVSDSFLRIVLIDFRQ